MQPDQCLHGRGILASGGLNHLAGAPRPDIVIAMATPAVFLDRDNTLIHNDDDLGDPALVDLIQGVPSAIASLRGLGYTIVVVTNQGGVARGRYGEDDVDAVHQRINELIRASSGAHINRFYYCPYHPDAVIDRYKREHPWRKPAPGMLLQAAKDMDIDLEQSWMIGDQMRDVEAGAAAGARTILLDQSAESKAPIKVEPSTGKIPMFTARNLIEATRIIAQQRVPDHADEEPKTALPHTTRANKPFRPWNAPSSEEDGDELAAPAVATPPTPTPASPAPAPASTRPAPIAGVPGADANLLKQILHELRAQRGAGSEFAYTKMLAVVLQMLALVCFVGAFWMAGPDTDMFLRWMASALMVQLATLAMLLFGR